MTAGSNKAWLDRFGPIIALFMFGIPILLSTPHRHSDPVNRTRVENVALIKAALDRFHSDRKAYPVLAPGAPLENLPDVLVQSGYLKPIPDAMEGVKAYISDGDRMYGLLLHLKTEDSLMTERLSGLCVVGVNIRGKGAWGNPPECILIP